MVPARIALLFCVPALVTAWLADDELDEPGESWVGGKADGSGAYRAKLMFDQGYVLVEILDDDLAHIEYGTGAGPSTDQPITRSLMVGDHHYEGPRRVDITRRRI